MTINKNILIVDDQATVRQALERLLRLESYEVIVAGDVREATSIYESFPIDLAIVDLGLPDGSGWDVVQGLLAVNPSFPSIVMTARPDLTTPALRERVTLLEKPLDMPVLLETVSTLLKPARQRFAANQFDVPEHYCALAGVSCAL